MHLIHKDLYNQSPVKKPMFTFQGEYRAVLKDLNGRVLIDTGWNKNAFTTYGYETLYVGAVYNLQIGDSGVANNPAFVTLPGLLHRKQGTNISQINTGTPDWRAEAILNTRFDPGEGTGTIREVGASRATDTGLMCRAVLGTPIVKEAEHTLDMYYKWIATPDLTDQTGQIVIAGITYDYTARLVTLGDWRDPFDGAGVHTGADYVHSGHSTVELPTAADSKNLYSYGQNMYRRNVVSAAGIETWQTFAYLTTCNYSLPGGVRSCFSRLTGGYQAGSDPCIGVSLEQVAGSPNPGMGVPKTEYDYLNIDWEVTWNTV